jgi:hypothetical protein
MKLSQLCATSRVRRLLNATSVHLVPTKPGASTDKDQGSIVEGCVERLCSVTVRRSWGDRTAGIHQTHCAPESRGAHPVPISGGFVLACQLLQQGCVQQLVQSANATESSTRSPTPEPRPEAPALGINYPTPTVEVLFVAEEALSVAECVSPVA